MVGLGDLAGGRVFSGGFGVSADGSVVVGWGASASGDEAFRWTADGGMVGLGQPFSAAGDVSADGSVVVGQGFSAAEAFTWDATHGVRELDVVLAGLGLDLTGWSLISADGISDDGRTIVGTGRNPDGSFEAWIAVVPEPATGLLLGAGLVALASSRRRPRQQAGDNLPPT